MMTQLTIDKAGRIVLPKPIRDELELAPGDVLEVESTSEVITIKPVRIGTPLAKERGVWVYRTGQGLPASAVDETVRELREDRARAVKGKTR